MWDEIKGFVVAFLVVPLALGCLYYVIYRGITGEWPDPIRGDCYSDYDGVRNPTVCD